MDSIIYSNSILLNNKPQLSSPLSFSIVTQTCRLNSRDASLSWWQGTPKNFTPKSEENSNRSKPQPRSASHYFCNSSNPTLIKPRYFLRGRETEFVKMKSRPSRSRLLNMAATVSLLCFPKGWKLITKREHSWVGEDRPRKFFNSQVPHLIGLISQVPLTHQSITRVAPASEGCLSQPFHHCLLAKLDPSGARSSLHYGDPAVSAYIIIVLRQFNSSSLWCTMKVTRRWA